MSYAVVEAPFAAVRRHVTANERPPPYVDVLIRVTYEAVIGQLRAPGARGGGPLNVDSSLSEKEHVRFGVSSKGAHQ